MKLLIIGLGISISAFCTLIWGTETIDEDGKYYLVVEVTPDFIIGLTASTLITALGLLNLFMTSDLATTILGIISVLLLSVALVSIEVLKRINLEEKLMKILSRKI